MLAFLKENSFSLTTNTKKIPTKKFPFVITSNTKFTAVYNYTANYNTSMEIRIYKFGGLVGNKTIELE